MKLLAKNNTILLKPVYEPWKRLSPLASTGEEIHTEQFGTVKTHGSQDYVNTKAGNHLAWGQVLDVGSGAAWMREHWPAGRPRHKDFIRPGDIIGFDQCQEVSLKVQGEETFFLPCDAALCRFNPEDGQPYPLQHYILTREEEDAGRKITFTGAAQKFHLPRSSATGSLKVSDSPHSQVKFAVERVVAIGAGGMGHDEIRTERSVHREERMVAEGRTAVLQSKVIEKVQTPIWIEPEPEAVGRLALFLFTMSVEVNIHGVRHRLTNWQRVRSLVDEEEADVRDATNEYERRAVAAGGIIPPGGRSEDWPIRKRGTLV